MNAGLIFTIVVLCVIVAGGIACAVSRLVLWLRGTQHLIWDERLGEDV